MEDLFVWLSFISAFLGVLAISSFIGDKIIGPALERRAKRQWYSGIIKDD